MKKNIRVFAVAMLITATVTGCGNCENRIATDGSSSIEKTIGILGEVFQNENKHISFSFNPTGSTAGITAVEEGRCDIGLSSRELKEEEIKAGLKATVLAYDGIAVIVNKENIVDDLDVETICKIYSGEITNWKEVGGNDGEIVLIGREAGSGTRDGFEAATDTEGKCKYRQELTSTGDVITTVTNNPNAIGYASIASVKETVKVLTVDGVEVNENTIKNGEYVIRRPFVMVTRKNKELPEIAKKFYEFVLSEEAEKYIDMAGVVPAN